MSEQPIVIPTPGKIQGTMVLESDPKHPDRARGLLDFGDFKGFVDVDLSRLTEREAVLTSRRRAMFVFTPAFYEAAQAILALQLQLAPERTMLILRDLLGEENADRFLEHMGLLGSSENVSSLDTPGDGHA